MQEIKHRVLGVGVGKGKAVGTGESSAGGEVPRGGVGGGRGPKYVGAGGHEGSTESM